MFAARTINGPQDRNRRRRFHAIVQHISSIPTAAYLRHNVLSRRRHYAIRHNVLTAPLTNIEIGPPDTDFTIVELGALLDENIINFERNPISDLRGAIGLILGNPTATAAPAPNIRGLNRCSYDPHAAFANFRGNGHLDDNLSLGDSASATFDLDDFADPPATAASATFNLHVVVNHPATAAAPPNGMIRGRYNPNTDFAYRRGNGSLINHSNAIITDFSGLVHRRLDSTLLNFEISNSDPSGGIGVDAIPDESQRKHLVKMAKFSCGAVFGISGNIIAAAINNTNTESGRSWDKLNHYKMSTAFGVVSFVAGIGLFISFHQYKNVKRSTLLVLTALAFISALAGILLLAMSVLFWST